MSAHWELLSIIYVSSGPAINTVVIFLSFLEDCDTKKQKQIPAYLSVSRASDEELSYMFDVICCEIIHHVINLSCRCN